MKLLARIRTWWVRWVWTHTPTCKEMTHLVSRDCDGPLPGTFRLRMRLHFMICTWCRRYSEQIAFLRHVTLRFAEGPALPAQGLTQEAKWRIAQRLQSAEATLASSERRRASCPTRTGFQNDL